MKPLEENELWAYVDGEISREDREKVSAWLKENPSLLQDLEKRRDWDSSIRRSLSSLKADHANLRESIMHEIEGGAQPEEKKPARFGYWVLAASIALLLLPLLYISQLPKNNNGTNIIRTPGETKMQEAGKFLLQIGNISERPANTAKWMDAGPAAKIGAGSLIRCHLNARTEIELEETILRMDENSDLEILGPRSIYLRNGRIWLNVLPSKEKFHVRTAHGEILVLGCKLYVSADDNGSLVAVEHDIVAVKSQHLPSTLLAEGEQIRVEAGGALAAETADLFVWREWMKPLFGKMEAEEFASLEHIAKKIENTNPWNPGDWESVGDKFAPALLHGLLHGVESELLRGQITRDLAIPRPWEVFQIPALLSLMKAEHEESILQDYYAALRNLLKAQELPSPGGKEFPGWENISFELSKLWTDKKKHMADKHGYDPKW